MGNTKQYGYHMTMGPRKQILVQLNEDLLGLLDAHAARAGTSRSQVIREAVKAHLAAEKEAEIDRLIAEGYRRMPQAEGHDTDDWGDVDRFMAALTVERMRHLNREEREAGFDPW